MVPQDKQEHFENEISNGSVVVYEQQLHSQRPWDKRRSVIWCTTSIILLMIASLVVAAVIGGIGQDMLPTKSSSNVGGGNTNEADDGNPQTTTLEPTFAPTLAVIAAVQSPTAQPTGQPTTVPSVEPTVFERTDPFAFYVIGDTPYADWQAEVLMEQLFDMKLSLRPGSAFLVHVGDFMRAKYTECSSQSYSIIKNILSESPLPTFVLAGDNDFLDCPDPDLAWSHYQDHFNHFEQEWQSRVASRQNQMTLSQVQRWNDSRPEMFSFVEDGILFLSLTLHRVDDEQADAAHKERLMASQDWVSMQLNQTSSVDIRGVVMFGHALLSGVVTEFFVDLKQVFMQHAMHTIPVLYIHGHGHTFNIDTDFGNDYDWTMFTELQVDQGAYADPLLIQVAPIKGSILQPLLEETDLQIVLADGLFRIDRQEGLYPERDEDD